jgi:hypothetical protein
VRVRITVGEVDIRLDEVELTVRQVRGLIKYAVGAAAAVAITTADGEDADGRQPIGFAATIERLPEEIPKDDLSWYDEE